jgi:hypothetical protein
MGAEVGRTWFVKISERLSSVRVTIDYKFDRENGVPGPLAELVTMIAALPSGAGTCPGWRPLRTVPFALAWVLSPAWSGWLP